MKGGSQPAAALFAFSANVSPSLEKSGNLLRKKRYFA
jgi:hypothetical protein